MDALGKRTHHWVLPKPLSSRSRIFACRGRLFVHVNGLPEKPRSTKPFSLITDIRPPLDGEAKGLPPLFSLAAKISLKSPIPNQGPENESITVERLFQNEEPLDDAYFGDFTSVVAISQIMYQNISGTTKTAKAMKFACSDTVSCSHLVLNNINLVKMDGTAETYCNSATGFGYGYV
ncbi:hypothetical protein RJ639_001267 [Escallonia herrerae]|uniref:Polygalacturonase n=1 Tax=Escallonia herrerae TaxID=1293975 RepID=A0AA88X8Z4_9ASTE|nr:hypothetical protein RJ639_001267 [Escallonia herrerae]